MRLNIFIVFSILQTDKEIQDFVRNKKKVKFPVFGKINVIDNDVPAAWQYLIG